MKTLTKKELAEALIIAAQYMPDHKHITEVNYAENTKHIKQERNQVDRVISKYEADVERGKE